MFQHGITSFSLSSEKDTYKWLKSGKLQPTLSWYKLRLLTFVNGSNRSTEAVRHQPGDQVDIFFHLEEKSCTSMTQLVDMLEYYKSLLNQSLLYAVDIPEALP